MADTSRQKAEAPKANPVHAFALSTNLAELHAELRPLLDLWASKCGVQGLPTRNSLSPRDLKPWLPRVHIYDVLPEGRFQARLLGTAIVQAIGQDQTGRQFGPQDQDPLAQRVTQILATVTGKAVPAVTTARQMASTRPSYYAAESLWLPMGAGTQVKSIIAATHLTLVEEAV